MRRRMHVRPTRPSHRDAHRVSDHASPQLVKTHHGWEDRQPGGVGRGPALRPQLVRFQVENRRLRTLPPAVGLDRLVKLVEPPSHRVDDDRVPVAALPQPVALHVIQRHPPPLVVDRPALDRHAVGHGKRPVVRLLRVKRDLHRNQLLIRRHQHKPHVAVVAQRLLGPDRRDNPPRVRMGRPPRNVLVPRVVVQRTPARIARILFGLRVYPNTTGRVSSPYPPPRRNTSPPSTPARPPAQE